VPKVDRIRLDFSDRHFVAREFCKPRFQYRWPEKNCKRCSGSLLNPVDAGYAVTTQIDASGRVALQKETL